MISVNKYLYTIKKDFKDYYGVLYDSVYSVFHRKYIDKLVASIISTVNNSTCYKFYGVRRKYSTYTIFIGFNNHMYNIEVSPVYVEDLYNKKLSTIKVDFSDTKSDDYCLGLLKFVYNNLPEIYCNILHINCGSIINRRKEYSILLYRGKTAFRINIEELI